MDFQTILYQTRDQIAFITFNRPDSLNAMNRQMTRELVDVCQQVEEDSGIRVAIFTGAGEKAFSAGMDLKERAETSFSPIERRQQKLTNKIYTQARAVAAITKPTIAAIRGYCVGGGLEFALACDLRVAAEDAKLGLTEVRRGIIPGAGGTQRLTRAVGVTKAMEMCLTGDTVSGLEAKSLGLVNNAVPSADVLKAAEDLAEPDTQRRADVRGVHQGSDQEGGGAAAGRRIAVGSRSLGIDRQHGRCERRSPGVCRKASAGLEGEIETQAVQTVQVVQTSRREFGSKGCA